MCCSLLQVLDVQFDGLLETLEAILTKVLLQDLLCTRLGQNLAQVLAVVFEIFRYLSIGANLAHDGEDGVPVIGFGEGEDTFIFDFGIDQGGNV